MHIKVSSPGHQLKQDEIDDIERDLEKIDRRLHEYREVEAQVRIVGNNSTPTHQVTLELHYGRNHLLAKAEHKDKGQALRQARDDVMRQINDRSRGGHSSFSKGR